MAEITLPPFPIDEATLDLLMASIDPWGHGQPDAKKSSLWDFLDLMSRMGGSDPDAVAEVLDPGRDVPDGATFMEQLSGAPIHMMRDPQYTDHCVITALVEEVRRLRAELAAAR